MSIEQTKWFRDLVNHMVTFGDNYKYTVNGKSRALDLARKHMTMRGREAIVRACKKANQRMKYKFYEWEKL